MKIPNFDLKKFSKTPYKLKAINAKNKYSYNQLIELMKKHKVNYEDKIKKLQNKVKNWKIDFKYKQEYIHLHLAYYYVKKGLFNNDYTNNSPKPVPEKIEKIFEDLGSFKEDLNEWLIKYL
jgi:heterodisulfide reductase subunit B